MSQDGSTPDGEVPSSKPVDRDAVREGTNPGREIYGFVATFVIAMVAFWLWDIVPEWRAAVVITAVVLGATLILLSERRRRRGAARSS